jgi:hypothetical protein
LKRVHLVKQLRLDEMKRKSQRLIEMKGVLAKEGRMEDLPEVEHVPYIEESSICLRFLLFI